MRQSMSTDTRWNGHTYRLFQQLHESRCCMFEDDAIFFYSFLYGLKFKNPRFRWYHLYIFCLRNERFLAIRSWRLANKTSTKTWRGNLTASRRLAAIQGSALLNPQYTARCQRPIHCPPTGGYPSNGWSCGVPRCCRSGFTHACTRI